MADSVPLSESIPDPESDEKLEKLDKPLEKSKSSISKIVNKFVPTKTVQALCRHTISASFAIGSFALTGYIANLLFRDELIGLIIHWIDAIGIALISVFLLVEFFIEIIGGKGNGKDKTE